MRIKYVLFRNGIFDREYGCLERALSYFYKRLSVDRMYKLAYHMSIQELIITNKPRKNNELGEELIGVSNNNYSDSKEKIVYSKKLFDLNIKDL